MLLLTLFVTSAISLFVIIRPYRKDKEEAIKIANQYTGLETVDSYSLFHFDESYYSLSGSTDSQDIHVLIPQDGGQILTFSAEEGVSANEVKEAVQKLGTQQIKRVTLGIIDNQPVWEVFSDGQFFYFNFKTGEQVSEEDI
ncbi:cell wall elongation regulator TseB-like domain-containing protein [Streptococcus rifensis]